MINTLTRKKECIIESNINEEIRKFSDFEVLTKDEVNRIYKIKKIKKTKLSIPAGHDIKP